MTRPHMQTLMVLPAAAVKLKERIGRVGVLQPVSHGTSSGTNPHMRPLLTKAPHTYL
jgi:hypothetical protein